MSEYFDTSRFTSNDWLEPITEEARTIFSSFPKETAVEIATAVLKSQTPAEEIPWATIFPSDNKSQVGLRLMKVLHTPDYRTPAYDLDTGLAVQQVQNLLARHRAEGFQHRHAAYHLVRAAAGDKHDEHFVVYQDMGRLWPQRAADWLGLLEEQFGDEGRAEILQSHPEFALQLGRTAAIAQLHSAQRGECRPAGESATELITRVIGFFNFSSVDDLGVETAGILERSFESYRQAAYEIRGLPAPGEAPTATDQ